MKATISTSTLQVMVQKVGPGVGNSKILPVTQYLQLSVNDGVFSITSTNASSFVCAVGMVDKWEPGSILVKADTFIKLIQKTKTDEVRLSSNDNQLTVHSHGVYKQALYKDREFPRWEKESLSLLGTVEAKLLKNRLDVHEGAVSSSMVRPEMTGFFIGTDRMVTTDDTRLCVSDLSGVSSRSILIPAPLAELLNQFDDEEEIRIYESAKALEFHSDTLQIRGPELLGLDRYPDSNKVSGQSFRYQFNLVLGDFLDTVDRVSLFSDTYYSFAIVISIEKGYVYITDVLDQTREAVEVSGDLGPDVRLVLNSQHLLGVLNRFNRDGVLMVSWNNDQDPVMIRTESSDETFYLTTVELGGNL